MMDWKSGTAMALSITSLTRVRVAPALRRVGPAFPANVGWPILRLTPSYAANGRSPHAD